MLTPDQEQWVAHLSDEDTIAIIPFDPSTAEKFANVKQNIQAALGDDVHVEHHGATSLGISGQDEIDIYLPVDPSDFDFMIDRLRRLYGEPRSLYPLERARFVTYEGGKHIDVFVINRTRPGWENMHRFESYLKAHPETLEGYRVLKERGAGLSGRAYYRRKLAFFNSVVSRS